MSVQPFIYGIGNVLIDILVRVSEKDMRDLGLTKGSMNLVDGPDRERLVDLVSSRDAVYACGGSAPNTTITLASMGIPSALSGKIGNDDFGLRYAARLKEHCVTSFLSVCEGETGSSIILITPDCQRTMNTSLCVNRDYGVTDINPEAIKQADYFFFTGYMWDTPNQKQALSRAVAIAREAGTRIVFDAADTFAVLRADGEFLPLIRDSVDIVLANAEEAKILTGKPDPEKAAERLSSLCDIAVVKNGMHGSYIRRGQDHYSIPVFPVKTEDTTGAGDIYAAGLIYGLCRGWDLFRSGLFASYLAGQIVRYTGAQFDPDVAAEIRRAAEDGSWETA